MTPRPDPERFATLVQTQGARVYRAAFSVLRRPEDAEDVAGEVFLRLLDGRIELKDAQDPGAVLATLAARAALQHRRGAGRRRQREDRHAMERALHHAGPADSASEGEQRELLRRELGRLAEDLRLPVALRYEAGLTYSDIGASLGCAEPTAHDRVRRGLEVLRRALTRAGLVTLTLSLEERLAAAAAPAPAGLETRLLSLSSKASLLTGGVASLAPLLLGVAVAGAAVWSAVGLGPTPSSEAAPELALELPPVGEDAHVAEEVAAAADQRRPATGPVSRADEPPARREQGFVTGRVLDGARFPVVGAKVVVVSTDMQGKRPTFAREGATDGSGVFRLPVEVLGGRRNVRVSVRGSGYVTLRTGSAWVHEDDTTDLGELLLELPEVVLVPRGEITTPAAARTIAGRLGTIDGGVPDRLDGTLRWSRDPNVWVDVPIDDQGRFRVDGLAADPYELWVRPKGNAPWSELRRQVGANESYVELLIKRADDARALGDHLAELHGRLVDAAGRPVVWRGIEVEPWWFPVKGEEDWERDVLPNHLSAPPVQRAATWEPGVDPYPAPTPSAEFHLDGLQPGRKVLYLSVAGYALDVAGPFDLEAEQVRAGIEVTLRPAASVQVTVLDADGERVDGAGVFVTGTGPYSQARVAAADAGYAEVDGRGFFDANRFRRAKRGRATIELLPAGRSLRIAAVHPRWEAVTGIELVLRAGERRVVQLRLRRLR